MAYSQEKYPCVSPGRCVQTGNGLLLTWPCSRSSWQKGRSEKYVAPYPERGEGEKKKTLMLLINIIYEHRGRQATTYIISSNE